MDEARRLVALAWPVVLGQLGLVGMGVVDLVVVGRLGPDATAAVGIGNTWSFGTLIVGLGASAGLDPLITQAFGARDPRRAGAEAARGAVVVALAALPIIALHLLGEPLFHWMRQPESAIPDAATYCRIVALSVPAFLGFAVVRQLLQADGAMRPAMWVIGLGNLVNLVADLVLVQGAGPIPGFGVAGVAMATTVVRWVMFAALLGVALPLLARSRPEPGWATPRAIARVAVVCLPVSLQIGLEVWAFNAASLFAGALGALPAAAHTAALSAASVAFMVPFGVSAAASTRVGNLVGAGRDWRRPAFTAIGLGAGAMTFSGLLFLLAPEAVGRFYNPDPAVVAAVGAVLPLAALFGWFDGTQVVAFGVLRGLGDTRHPALFNLVGYWVLGLPLGVWLAFRGGQGLAGLWIGLVIGLGVVAVLLVGRLARHARGPGLPAGADPAG